MNKYVNNSLNKKSQMELMGLAIIVVLLSLAMVFVIRFVLLKPETSQAKEYTESELSANFLNTLVETNAPDCSNIKFSTLFQDCANNKNTGAGGTIPCGSQYSSCAYLHDKTKDILTNTFDKWHYSYYFIASMKLDDETAKIFEPIGSLCTGDRKGKQQPLPLGNGENLFLSFYICS